MSSELRYVAIECQHFENYWILTYDSDDGLVFELVNGHKPVKVSKDIHELYEYLDKIKGQDERET